MEEVDNLMAGKYNIDLFQMMENAGLNLALLAKNLYLNDDKQNQTVMIFAGSGGNGGGVMVAARRLHNWGIKVKIVLAEGDESLKPVTRRQYNIAKQIKIPFVKKIDKEACLILDGLIGYSLKANPDENISSHIEMINKSGIPVIAMDCPSGIDLDTGKPAKPTVKAKATMSLALPKRGHYKMMGARNMGDIYLADIGVPPELYKVFDFNPDDISKIFQQGTVVKINKLVVFD